MLSRQVTPLREAFNRKEIEGTWNILWNPPRNEDCGEQNSQGLQGELTSLVILLLLCINKGFLIHGFHKCLKICDYEMTKRILFQPAETYLELLFSKEKMFPFKYFRTGWYVGMFLSCKPSFLNSKSICMVFTHIFVYYPTPELGSRVEVTYQ